MKTPVIQMLIRDATPKVSNTGGRDTYIVESAAVLPTVSGRGLRTVDRPAARRTGLELPQSPGG